MAYGMFYFIIVGESDNKWALYLATTHALRGKGIPSLPQRLGTIGINMLTHGSIAIAPTCITLDIFRTGMIAKSKPAAVRLYDYYEPKKQVTKFYESHLLKNSDICDVCVECGCQDV